MISIKEYINNYFCDQTIITEEANLIAEDMVNESFKSSILQSLAQAIYNAEKVSNQRKVDRAKEDDEKYPYSDGSKRDPQVTSFASIFGPKTEGGKYNLKKGLQGLKWSEISDDDFKEFSPADKELHKLIKATYGKKEANADFIIMGKDNTVLNFIKAYGTDPKRDGVFYFKAKGDWNDGVKEITKPYYSYQTRALKAGEVISMLKELAQVESIKVYALEITPEMTKDYKALQTSREEAQKGVINFDKNSLKELLYKQQSRYKTLVAEIKAKKLQKDPNVLFDEIKKTNDEVVSLYKQIINTPENLDQSFDLGRLMSYISYSYESLYKSMAASREGDRSYASAKRHGDTDEEAKRWRHYDDKRAESEINDSKEYLEKVKKEIEKIKANLK